MGAESDGGHLLQKRQTFWLQCDSAPSICQRQKPPQCGGFAIGDLGVPEGFRTLNIVIHSCVTEVLLHAPLICTGRKSHQTIDNRIALQRLDVPLPGCHAIHPLHGHSVCRPSGHRANSGTGLSINRYAAPDLLELNVSHLRIVHPITSPVTIPAKPTKFQGIHRLRLSC